MAVQHLIENCANVSINSASQAVKTFERALCGVLSPTGISKMATLSVIQSKDLIIPNIKQTAESIDSAVFCVCGGERKKQRIGVRLTIAERQSLELAAKQKNMTLSNLISQFARTFAQQKSA